MKTEYYKVKLDFTEGNAYNYRKDSDIPTIISFGRQHSGKFQEDVIKGVFNNQQLHNIMYCIKRGMLLEEIKYYINKL